VSLALFAGARCSDVGDQRERRGVAAVSVARARGRAVGSTA
jgi:hypothetical protein